MKIAICDDHEKDLHMIYMVIRHTLSELSMDCKIITFRRSKDLIQRMYEYNLLVLDIDMPDINGIEIKEKLQKTNEDILIIFVTGYEDRIKEAFGNHVLSYIKKEDMEEELPRFIRRAVDILDHFIFLEDELDSRRVMFIKAENIYSDLYLSNGERKQSRISLNQYERLLMEVDFVRIHRSYLVNLRHITKITNKGIHIGRTILPVSTRLRKNVVKKFNKYILKNARY